MEGRVHATSIAGVEYMDLDVVRAPAGNVLHMLRPDLPFARTLDAATLAVGEIYFSEARPGQVKAWKRHARQTQHLCVPAGRLGVVLYDDRAHSLTRGAVQGIVLGPADTYALLRIPPLVWYGFCALGEEGALVCNAADIPHDPDEAERRDFREATDFPFDWTSGEALARLGNGEPVQEAGR